MVNKNAFTYSILCSAAALSLYVSDLNAWQRKPVNYSKCQADNISSIRCEKQAEEDNQHDFETQLSTNSYKTYNDFLPEQKRQAMDFADNNRMPPDAAVARVRASQ